jgi:hypothetical protein
MERRKRGNSFTPNQLTLGAMRPGVKHYNGGVDSSMILRGLRGPTRS